VALRRLDETPRLPTAARHPARSVRSRFAWSVRATPASATCFPSAIQETAGGGTRSRPPTVARSPSSSEATVPRRSATGVRPSAAPSRPVSSAALCRMEARWRHGTARSSRRGEAPASSRAAHPPRASPGRSIASTWTTFRLARTSRPCAAFKPATTTVGAPQTPEWSVSRCRSSIPRCRRSSVLSPERVLSRCASRCQQVVSAEVAGMLGSALLTRKHAGFRAGFRPLGIVAPAVAGSNPVGHPSRFLLHQASRFSR
jgi:hypothetical protein